MVEVDLRAPGLLLVRGFPLEALLPRIYPVPPKIQQGPLSVSSLHWGLCSWDGDHKKKNSADVIPARPEKKTMVLRPERPESILCLLKQGRLSVSSLLVWQV